MPLDNNKIALVCALPYPIGNVSALRIHSYCKVLAAKGYFVKIIIFCPQSINENKLPLGIYEGVHYQYLSGLKWKKTDSFYNKGITYLKGIFRTLKLLKKENYNCILSYHSELLSNIVFSLFAKFNRINFIIDKTEYPYGYSKKTKTQQFLERKKLLFFDGFIVISKELYDFYYKIKKNVFLLPMTIDPNRFNDVKKITTDDYIAVVFGKHDRDGLFDSVKAYNIYASRSESPMKLMLIGNFEYLCKLNPDYLALPQFIEDNNLQDLIEFTGSLLLHEVPEKLINASCLLTTPRFYDSGGFPTKLGEYMLSGVPVVATSAGEISDYVTNRQDIFLCPVDNLDAVAESILFIQENKDMAKKIGENAIVTAKTKFNAETYIDSLIDFAVKK